MGLDETLEHIPAKGARGDWIKVYCVAKFRRGHHIEVMDKEGPEGVYAIRDKFSESYKAFKDEKIKDTPWVSSEGEMARKTVLRRARKYWPMSVEDQRKINLAGALDDAIDKGHVVDVDADGEVQYIAPASDSEMLTTGTPVRSGRMLDHIADPESQAEAERLTETKAKHETKGETKKTTKATPKTRAKKEPPSEKQEISEPPAAEADSEASAQQGGASLGPLTVYDTDGTMIAEHEDPGDYLQAVMNAIIAAQNRVSIFKANDPTIATVLKARPDLQGSVDMINEYRPS
jgi:recombination protein RecT